MLNDQPLSDDGIHISAEGNVTIHGDIIGGDKSDDILDVVLATLSNPALGLAEVVRKVAAKARNS